jgi:mannosyltransferase
VILVALGARLYDLNAESIWTDEAFSIAMAHRPVADIIAQTADEDTTPPLYYLALHGWQAVFGDSPVAARLPSVIAGTLAVLFAYLAAAPLIGTAGALVAAAFHAVSPFLVAYSQEARQYSLLSCASAASFAFLIRLLQGQRFGTPAYIAAAIAMCYSHSVGSFVLFSQFVLVTTCALIGRADRWRRAYAAQCVAMGAFLPWALVSLAQYRRLGGAFWVPVPTLFSIVETFYEYAESTLLAELFMLLAILGFVRVIPGPTSYTLRNPLRSLEEKNWTVYLADTVTSLVLACWLVGPIAIPFVISKVGTPIYLSRATIAAASAFYLMVARGLMQLNGPVRQATLILVLLLLSVELRGYYRETTHEQWNRMVADVSVWTRPGDVFIFHDRSRQRAFDYYFRLDNVHRVAFPDRKFRDADSVTAEDMHAFPRWVEANRRVWLVLAHSKDSRQLISTHILRSHRLVFRRQYAGIDVQAFEKVDAVQEVPR